MEIVFQNHDAPVSDSMRRRAEQALRKVARRAGGRAVDGVIRFQQDGATRRVELTMHTGDGRRYVANANARYFGSALSDAARKLSTQVDHTKRTPKARARKLTRRHTPSGREGGRAL
ncbi:MAG: HPF/RaiA family ribosome-associated protein [Gemmatimonadaceae bacterium]